MKNLILALVFLILLVGAAFAVTRGSSVGLRHTPEGQAACAQNSGSCTGAKATNSHCGSKAADAKRVCPFTGKEL